MADDTTAPALTGSPDVIMVGRLRASGKLVATARLLGARIRTRDLAGDPTFARTAEAAGLAFVFRYGAVVTIGSGSGSGSGSGGGGSSDHEAALLDAALAPHLDDPIAEPECESAEIAIRPGEERIETDGLIVLTDTLPERMELVATVLSRSVVLARDELAVSAAFDRSAPLVTELRTNGRVNLPIRSVMRMVGDALAARHRVTGAAQVDERPDLLWDHPELDRLYQRLEGEYELSERAEVLHGKLEALGDFAEALLDIVQTKRSYRVEIAIIALIAFEVVLSLWEKVWG